MKTLILEDEELDVLRAVTDIAEPLDITPRLANEEQRAHEARVGFVRSVLASLKEKLLAAG